MAAMVMAGHDLSTVVAPSRRQCSAMVGSSQAVPGLVAVTLCLGWVLSASHARLWLGLYLDVLSTGVKFIKLKT